MRAQVKLKLRDLKHNQCIVTRSLEATQKVGNIDQGGTHIRDNVQNSMSKKGNH